MKIFDFFKKKKGEEIESVVEEKNIVIEPQKDVLNYVDNILCDYCGKKILKEHRHKNIKGQLFHRQCYKQIKKEATKLVFK